MQVGVEYIRWGLRFKTKRKYVVISIFIFLGENVKLV